MNVTSPRKPRALSPLLPLRARLSQHHINPRQKSLLIIIIRSCNVMKDTKERGETVEKLDWVTEKKSGAEKSEQRGTEEKANEKNEKSWEGAKARRKSSEEARTCGTASCEWGRKISNLPQIPRIKHSGTLHMIHFVLHAFEQLSHVQPPDAVGRVAVVFDE